MHSMKVILVAALLIFSSWMIPGERKDDDWLHISGAYFAFQR